MITKDTFKPGDMFQKGDIITNDHYAKLGQFYEFVSQEGDVTHVLRLPEREVTTFTCCGSLYLVERPYKFKLGDIVVHEDEASIIPNPVQGEVIGLLEGSKIRVDFGEWGVLEYKNSLLRLVGKAEVVLNNATSPNEAVAHPQHYGGADNTYEAIKVIEAWELGFSLGNTVKYISRAGKKSALKEIEDLEKAAWYLNRKIDKLKAEDNA